MSIMETQSVPRTTSSKPVVRRRLRVNRIVSAFSVAATVAGLFLLAWILGYLLVKGFSTLSLTLFTLDTPPPGSAGGLANAIIGSLMITGVGILIATPVGILAGTFLIEYGRGSKLAEIIRFVNDMLVSAPSIIIGLFVYQVVVAPMHHFSAWAGAIALGIIALPIIVRTTQDMLQLVPDALREAAYALGAPKWRVIVVVSYRAAFQGMLTGVLLAVARISGETAPLLFTALSNPSSTTNMSSPMATLPVVIYKFAGAPYTDWQNLAWAGALLITFSVLVLNIAARSFAPRIRD
jgi:phosphate transport system permease protein